MPRQHAYGLVCAVGRLQGGCISCPRATCVAWLVAACSMHVWLQVLVLTACRACGSCLPLSCVPVRGCGGWDGLVSQRPCVLLWSGLSSRGKHAGRPDMGLISLLRVVGAVCLCVCGKARDRQTVPDMSHRWFVVDVSIRIGVWPVASLFQEASPFVWTGRACGDQSFGTLEPALLCTETFL